MLWRIVLALDQGLNRQYETWIFQLSHGNTHGFVCDIPLLLCHREWFPLYGLCRSASGLLWGEMWWKSQQLTVCRRASGLHGSVVSLPLLSARETPKIFLQLLRHEVGHEETECRLKKTGTVLVFRDRMGTYFVFPQAGHGSENIYLEGKMVFSQEVWGTCDPLQHQRHLLLAFCVACQFSKASSCDSSNSTSVRGKCVLLHPRQVCGWGPC